MSAARTVTIVNQRGLHARAAGRFVKLAGGYAATVTVSSQGEAVSGLSIMGLLMLGAARGARLDIVAEGPDATAAVDALADLVETGFGEDTGTQPPRP